ncbi:MAG: hypothetical protein RIC14_12390 [Filomicrobium sp.]
MGDRPCPARVWLNEVLVLTSSHSEDKDQLGNEINALMVHGAALLGLIARLVKKCAKLLGLPLVPENVHGRIHKDA